ncbi:MAG TPA: Gfo/Idh/MocA family oxidoreductase [Sumerlaeia bacterium]|nr:Gfo/Idh/MocA family oxidoreductase [Sumerlaeia bacterium]
MAKRVCVVGAGRWGKNHIRTLHELGCLGGIVESNSEKLSEFSKAYPRAKTFGSVKEAVGEDFDGYTVATPAETHFDVAAFIIQHGRHVLVEKPITLTAADARELKRMAESNGVNLMVGHVLLFHPAIRKIKELLDEDKIGKLQYLYSNRLNLGTVRTEENILWSFAPHDISIFQHLIGAMPSEIISRGGAFLQPHIHDSTLTILTYPDNIVGHIFVSWLHPFKEHRMVVIGSKGMLSFEDSSENKDILFYRKGIDWIEGEPVTREGATEVIPYDREMPLAAELRYFVDRLDGSPVEKANAQNAVEVLEILESASAELLSAKAPARPSTPGPQEERKRFIHETSYVDDGVEIGEGTKIWHFSHVQSGSRIGRKCVLGQNVNVGNNVHIGNFVKIQNNVSIYEGITLEDYVFCGPSMVFTNIRDPRSKYPQAGSKYYLKTLVKEGASMGANSTIVCGHTIGRHAFIAAGATVTKDVPDYALMMGVPARQKGWVCECGEILPSFEDAVTCPRCSLKYALRDGALAPAER